MGGTAHTTMRVLITLCAAVAAVSAAPRYLVIPIEDVDMSMFSGQTLPVYRVPGLARTALVTPTPPRTPPRRTPGPTTWTTERTPAVTAPSAGTPTTPCCSAPATSPTP